MVTVHTLTLLMNLTVVKAKGTEMIGMCSKTYLLKSEDDCKVSCKGVNKIQNPYESFLKVITEKMPLMSTNRGIRNVNRTTVSYTLQKTAINYSSGSGRF